MYFDHFCPVPILPLPSPPNPTLCPLYWFRNPSLICTGCKSLGVWSPLERVEWPGATCLEKRFSSQGLLHKGLDLMPPTSSCRILSATYFLMPDSVCHLLPHAGFCLPPISSRRILSATYFLMPGFCLPPTSSRRILSATYFLMWDSVCLELAQVLHMLSNPCTSALSCLENTVSLSLPMCPEIWAIKLVNRLRHRQAKHVSIDARWCMTCTQTMYARAVLHQLTGESLMLEGEWQRPPTIPAQ